MSKLVLLNTPIGNVKDITQRSKEALEKAELIFSEDTRVLKKLLESLEIDYSLKSIDSYHDQSSESKLKKIQNLLKSGKTIYYASDAGSPVLSDPAYLLVKFCRQEGIEIETYSGISAVTAALELSGMPPIPFKFNGFLPRDLGKVKSSFEEINSEAATHIFFESPHRMKKTLMALESSFSKEVEVCVVKEISKTYQRVYNFKVEQLSEVLEKIDYRGEFVLLIHIDKKSTIKSSELIHLANEVINTKAKSKTVAKLLAKILDKNPKEIYGEL